MDPDLNKYDLNHRVSHHPEMSDSEWERVYREAWDAYYDLPPYQDDFAPRRRGRPAALPAVDPVHAAVVPPDDRLLRISILWKAARSG